MTVQLLDKDLQDYAESMTTAPSELLQEIDIYTQENVALPVMLSGYLQGRILAMMSKMIEPRYILEIGTYTGYSAICLAEGLQEDGKLYTIDQNEEIADQTREFLARSPHADQIEFLVGDAKEIIPNLDFAWDLVFLDADKKGYYSYYEMLIDKLPQGAYIIADNVLYNGEVLDTEPKRNAKAIVDFNKKIKNDDRVEQVLIPVRDGMTVIRKIK